jgi:hypothetical protein
MPKGIAVYSALMSRAASITKEQIKSEVDKVRDEYLGVLYRIILALEEPARRPHPEPGEAVGWSQFISELYGSTADAPLQRWPEGASEERLALE